MTQNKMGEIEKLKFIMLLLSTCWWPARMAPCQYTFIGTLNPKPCGTQLQYAAIRERTVQI